MLTIEDIIKILRDMVIYTPEVAPGVRLNSFALVDKRSDLNDPALGMQYEDYLDGICWARDWVYAGASAGTGFAKEYPCLTMEHKVVERESISRRFAVVKIYLHVHNTPDCGGRLHTAATREKVYQWNFAMMNSLLKELESVGLYETDPLGADPVFEEWISEGRAAYLSNESLVDSIFPQGTDLKSFIHTVGYQVYKTPSIAPDGAYTVTTQLDIEVCLDEPAPYQYRVPDFKTVGVTGFNNYGQ